ncbi:MAG: hypothetical protein ACRD2P_18060 [Terriglobia bacterium]
MDSRQKRFGRRVLLAVSLALLGAAGAMSSPPQPQAQAQSAQTSKAKPLGTDDVTLLLIGGASPQKMILLIRQRGVDFVLDPDLVKQFYQDGATDDVIDALQKGGEAFEKAREALKAQPGAAAPPRPASPQAPASPPEAATPLPQAASTPGEMPVHESGAPPATNVVKPAAKPPVARSQPAPSAAHAPVNQEASNAPLPDPSAAQLQQIIQEFAAKEKLFETALDNYTYHQINKAETIDANGNVDGSWEQDWDILFGADGKRIEQVTYAPEDTLRRVSITEQDIQSFRTLQPFTVTTDTLPEYDVQYMGHVHVDYITCYVFSVRPKEIKKGHLYFKGVVWVDDHDIQIVKAEGQIVPQTKNNRFPRFTTWRQQIDGKYWFPTFTQADDTLYFDGGPPVHIKEIVKYTDYKQFKSRTKILSSAPVGETPRSPPGKP